MSQQIAVVTGANRGIGFEISRQLAAKGIKVILTSRDAVKGEQAVQELTSQGLDVESMVLNVAWPDSIQKFSQALIQKHGRVDILVNNAGILIDRQRQQPSVFDVELSTIQQTLETNVYGPLLLIQALVPLMQKQGYGRIVNISSGMGQLSDMGGGHAAYRLSKVSLNALTRIVDAELKDTQHVKINTMCPGWVRTDMGGAHASRSVEQGADTAVWLATLPEDGPSGGFFRDRQRIEW